VRTPEQAQAFRAKLKAREPQLRVVDIELRRIAAARREATLAEQRKTRGTLLLAIEQAFRGEGRRHVRSSRESLYATILKDVQTYLWGEELEGL
jgi:hypothetical protein